MPGGGGGGGTIPTTTNSNTSINMGPWNEQGPYLKQGFAQAGGLAFGGNNPTYVPWNTTQSSAFQNLVNTAQGSPIFPAASGNYLDTLAGKYLDPSTNPWLKSTFEAASAPVAQTFQNITAPTTDAMFGSAGPLSGGGYANAQSNNEQNLSRMLNQLATSIYGGNYAQERTNQMGALGMLPQFQMGAYTDPMMMMQAGGMNQAEMERELNAPWAQLQKYMGIVGSGNWGQSGNTQTQSRQETPYFSNPLGQGIGALLGLGSLAIPGIGGASALGNIFGGLGGIFGGGAGAGGFGGLTPGTMGGFL